MSETNESPQAPTNSNSFYAVALVFLVLLAVISGFYLGKQTKNSTTPLSSPVVSSIPSQVVESPAASVSATPIASVSAVPVASNLPVSPEATTSGGLY